MSGITSGHLRLAFIALLLLGVVGVTATILHRQHLQNVLDSGEQTIQQKIALVSALQSVIEERIILLSTLLSTTDPFSVEENYPLFIELGAVCLQKRTLLERGASSGDERSLLAGFRQLAKSSGPTISRAINMVRLDVPSDEKQQMLTQVHALHREMLVRNETIREYYLGQMERIDKDAQGANQRWWQLEIFLGAAIILIFIYAALYFRRRAVKQHQLLIHELKKGQRFERELDSHKEHIHILKARMKHLYEAQRIVRMGCWEWDLIHDKMEWADEFIAILGVEKKSTKPSLEWLLQQIHPDERESVKEMIMEVVKHGVPIDMDFRLSHNGTERVVQGRVVVERRDEAGKPTHLLGTLQDITERKRVEGQLRLAASVFAHTGDGVMITDSDNRIIEVNSAFTRILGYRLEEVSGKNPSILKSPRHRRSFYRSMWQSLQQSGQWQGEIWDRHKSGQIVPLWMTINTVHDERGRRRHYVALFRDISEVKRTEQTLWHIAHHDPLTGLPNRNLMYDRLRVAMSEAAREDLQVALLLIDLDGFKRINDELGHDAGDELLKHVAQILSESVRESDTVARYAGDEFVAVIKGMHERDDVGVLSHKLIDRLMQPQMLKKNKIIVGASIGISLYPAHATDAEDLITKADEAMYQAKRLGKGRSCFFGNDCD